MVQQITTDEHCQNNRIAIHGIAFTLKVGKLNIAVHNNSHSQRHDAGHNRRKLKAGKHVSSNAAGTARDRHPLEVTVDYRGVHIKTRQAHGTEERKQTGDNFTPPAQVCQGEMIN